LGFKAAKLGAIFVSQPVARIVRWRRRQVAKVRVTWIAQVGLLLSLVDDYLMQQFPMGMGGKVAMTALVVVLPVALLSLWRAGLLPPERYETEAPVWRPGPSLPPGDGTNPPPTP
jgi:hypothetical protein